MIQLAVHPCAVRNSTLERRADLCSVRFNVYVGDGKNGDCIVDGATTYTLLPSCINKRGVPGAEGEYHQAARGDACCGAGVGDGTSSVVAGISQNDENNAALRGNGGGCRTMCGKEDNGNNGAYSGGHCVPSAQARPDGATEMSSRSSAGHADQNIASPTAVTDSATSASPPIKRGIENYQALVRVPNKPAWRDLTDTVIDEGLNLDFPLDELEIGSDEEVYERYDPEVFLLASLTEVEVVKSMRVDPHVEIEAASDLYKRTDDSTATHLLPDYRHSWSIRLLGASSPTFPSTFGSKLSWICQCQ
ncbi:unnamed protein product [Phytophthora fragariaefolia]|uniref:Unnamed protein product n=1 Tax=Phytophthora fragariaefolia TaxID=1490495 RepID=A0A9W6XF02_9STRA|nr:unnamed protein product [Phytophthora fragariaefolia]